MGATGAVEILNRTEIAAADDPEARKAELVDDYTEKWLNPYVAAERGYVDDVIDPADTRQKLIDGPGHARVQEGGAPAPQARQHAAVTRADRDPRITPDPTDEEVAAIVAAVEAAWPRAARRRRRDPAAALALVAAAGGPSRCPAPPPPLVAQPSCACASRSIRRKRARRGCID